MKYLLFATLMLFCSCRFGSSKKEQNNNESDSICLQKDSSTLKHSVDGVFESDTLQQSIIALDPLSGPRDILIRETINPDSLSMRTEYDYYPLSTTKVKVIIINHSHYEYNCGENYSLAYYNQEQKSWETLPPIL